MKRKVLLVENKDGWGVYDALEGDVLMEELSSLEEALGLCEKASYQTPYRGDSESFFHDLEGEPLYESELTKGKDLELEYSDGVPLMDFEICPVCKGPAIGRDHGGHNCYYCAECDKDIDCVPPPEWIGAVD